MASGLTAAFAALRREVRLPAIGTFAARPLRARSNHLIALTSDGLPCLLLHAVDTRRSAIPPLRLSGLEIQYDIECQISVRNAPTAHDVYTTVVCTVAASRERNYFLLAAEMVLRSVGNSPTVEGIAIATRHLANLFQKLARPPQKSVTGLIGELVFLDMAAVPAEAVRSWRVADSDRFDFICESVRVDVKATERRERSHHLTYEQCNPPIGTRGLLASLLIESTGGGVSLEELMASIERKLSHERDAIVKLHETVVATLGQTLPQALSSRFDYALAVSSLKLFDAAMVPGIRGDLPNSVSEVRFKVHLGNEPEVNLDSLVLTPGESRILPSQQQK